MVFSLCPWLGGKYCELAEGLWLYLQAQLLIRMVAIWLKSNLFSELMK